MLDRRVSKRGRDVGFLLVQGNLLFAILEHRCLKKGGELGDSGCGSKRRPELRGAGRGGRSEERVYTYALFCNYY